jgi:hypothetical protein
MITITTTITIEKDRAEHARPHVYFFHQGEDIGHNLTWRHFRPTQLYFDLLPLILRQAGLLVTDEEEQQPTVLGQWNQFAACQCGCSPGIVLTRPGRHDLYVTIAVAAIAVVENAPRNPTRRE